MIMDTCSGSTIQYSWIFGTVEKTLCNEATLHDTENVLRMYFLTKCQFVVKGSKMQFVYTIWGGES